MSNSESASASHVVLIADSRMDSIVALLARYQLEVVGVDAGCSIPGSYWGDSEAGLKGNRVYCRRDTPLHSLLHEASHFVCIDPVRRSQLERDAGGDYEEENAVCYLQIVLADEIDGFGSQRMCLDMDTWGYTFRLGSAGAWFERDAGDARAWLLCNEIVGDNGRPTWRRRESPRGR